MQWCGVKEGKGWGKVGESLQCMCKGHVSVLIYMCMVEKVQVLLPSSLRGERRITMGEGTKAPGM